MYEKFFYLNENPFHITPDPKFLYLSRKHQEAIDLLLYGIEERKGFLLLTGEVGTGKTTISRIILDRLKGNADTALILNPVFSGFDLLRTINEDFGIEVKGDSTKDHLDALNAFLIERSYAGGNVAVIIDEAQNLKPKALEMVRLLSNLETEKMKLLQIVLIGQPELREKLKMPELRQLNQRILVRYHLEPLDEGETVAYIHTRLTIAGCRGSVRFTSKAMPIIYRTCGGIPRMINTFCHRALTAAFVEEKRVIDRAIADKVMEELNREGAADGRVDMPRYGIGILRYARYLVPTSVLLLAVFLTTVYSIDYLSGQGSPVEGGGAIRSTLMRIRADERAQLQGPVESSSPSQSHKSIKRTVKIRSLADGNSERLP
ncbi:MAG: ExeA family protein [Thermodesulfobacteriota bacterium]